MSTSELPASDTRKRRYFSDLGESTNVPLTVPSRRPRSKRSSDFFTSDDSIDESFVEDSISPVALMLSTQESTVEQFDAYLSNEKSITQLDQNEAVAQIDITIRQQNNELMSHVDKITQEINEKREISIRLRKMHLANVKGARESVKFEIAYHNYIQEFHEIEVNRIKKNIEVCVLFLQKLNEPEARAKYVDIAQFLCQNIIPQPKLELFLTRASTLKTKFQNFYVPPLDENDIVGQYLDPATKIGKMMRRVSITIKDVRYPDFDVISDAIVKIKMGIPIAKKDKKGNHKNQQKDVKPLEENSQEFKALKAQVLTDMFTVAWYFKVFPLHDHMSIIRLPMLGALVPAVLKPAFIDDKWNFMTFSELYRADWPFRPAVDKMWDLMINLNPFEIAKEFYDIIQLIGKCVSEVVKSRDSTKKRVDIDFDQLFSLILVCVFASGIQEILGPMTYCYGFREFMHSSYELDYAMSYLEAVCVHLSSLDFKALWKQNIRVCRKGKIRNFFKKKE